LFPILMHLLDVNPDYKVLHLPYIIYKYMLRHFGDL
jgi:hypothetical protein